MVLLARVAEQLYWAARYLERAEGTARVVNEHTNLLVDLPTTVPLTWEPLLAIPDMRPQFDERYPGDGRPGEHDIVHFLLVESDNPSSVLATVTAARENLRTAREVIPRGAWHALNDLYLYVTSHRLEGVDRRSRGRFLDRVVAEHQRFVGILVGTMSRDLAFQVLRLGRNLERADMISRVLDVRAVSLLEGAQDEPQLHDEVQWAAVLQSLSGLQPYHRRCRAPVEGRLVVDFLLCDPDFPGSIRHCLDEVTAVVAGLPRGDGPRAAALRAIRTLERVDAAPLIELHDGLDAIQVAIAAVHDAVQATYFPPPPVAEAAAEAPDDDASSEDDADAADGGESETSEKSQKSGSSANGDDPGGHGSAAYGDEMETRTE
jgi:uncharacterized alpha-E superfamily protein